MIQSTFFAGFLGGVIAGLRLAVEGARWCDIAAQMTIDRVGLPIPRFGPRALTFGYRDFSDLNVDPALRVRLTGSLAGGLNL